MYLIHIYQKNIKMHFPQNLVFKLLILTSHERTVFGGDMILIIF